MVFDLFRNISIHALLAESDSARVNSMLTLIHFYPRSPCGERHLQPGYRALIHSFLSTLSLRRATSIFSTCSICKTISIHALLAESDNGSMEKGQVYYIISIHALLAESDSKSAQNSGALLRIWNKFYGDCIFMLTGKAVFYPFCPCFFHIFWCEGTGNFMIAFPSH